jgi:hypothetical protein
MAIKFIDPQGKEHAASPRSIRLEDGRTASLPAEITAKGWEAIKGCSTKDVAVILPNPAIAKARADAIEAAAVPIRDLLAKAGLDSLPALFVALTDAGGSWGDV